SGRPESAQQMYERALELDPTSPIMHHVYAHVLMRLGRDADAERHFRRAIEIDPGFSRAYQGLATHYFSLQGRIADAALPARHAALLNPSHATNFALLASIYLHLGDVTQAEHWLAEANRLEPDGLSSLRTSTLFHLYREDDAAAVESARTGLEKHPQDMLFLAVVRDQLLTEGKLVEAIELYEAAFPSLVIANACDTISGCWIALEYAYLIKQSNSHARVEELLQAVEVRIAALIDEGHPRSLLLEAALYVQREKNAAAIDSLRRAVDRGWRKDAFYHLADDPLFSELHDRPEFQELAGVVRADMAAQLQGLREKTGADIFSGRRFVPARR
ncbi:MAG: tetratricopeptide repeat protein, partial [Pseudomonadota bacterium]